ncbi:DEAD/DEAH box helicase [Fulvivirga sp. 29W222]|uniref:DEAD/DEAH box helicase n=1 Tax=Fulvivirga marina TaxID=2494733 RepID=A0A937KFY2_9BACT|nr:DEAD/DEAH box helicase [Fulvivirga marina]MBL6448790.1 DEAD/DEAH box helicase [Fulvivirga marina]
MYRTKQRPTKRTSNFNRNSGGNRNRNKKKNNNSSSIDINKFISKAIAPEQKEVYQVTNKFVDFPLQQGLIKRIEDRGYSSPTEIQDKSINHILAGKDVVGIAGTGTGKTGAFLIPIINRLLTEPAFFDTLIITPTRELALQIEDEFRKLTRATKLRSITLIGGTNMNKSMAAFSRPAHIVIGTPGRIMDMAQRGKLAFRKFPVLILDEFDRMLDMGFIRDIERVISQMTARKQTLLFSATMPASQEGIIKKIIPTPVKVKASSALKSSNNVDQNVVSVSEGENKFDSLMSVISSDNEKDSRVILFCETKRKASKLAKKLNVTGIPSDEIHGNKSQLARERALKKFKTGQIRVLVATDVMARGIDVTDVSMVINYEVPRTYDDYIHRIGRTGRAGKTGKAVTFIN